MSRHVFKLPDLGEGTVSAEIVAWHVRPGDLVAEDQPLVEMSTDKAVVEVPSPVSGRVLTLNGAPGEAIAVGAELAVFDTEAAGSRVDSSAAAASTTAPPPSASEGPAGATPRAMAEVVSPEPASTVVGPPGGGTARRVMASPATRRRAREAGIDLAQVAGSGPGGRILGSDLETAPAPASTRGTAARTAVPPKAVPVGPQAAPAPPSGPAPSDDPGITAIPVIGIRRVIAQRMAEAKREAPHFAYVEEVDVTALEALRLHLNSRLPAGQAPLTYLPFVVAALVPVLAEFPQCNAQHDAAGNRVLRHRAVHVGIATQSPDGLKVPVVRDVGGRRLWDLAAEIRRVTEAARSNRARREELTGSTITVTSLGKLGGIVSTPILNLPEVAIIGLNKAVERPVVINGNITVRRMMNLSSSFDHRFVDGFDAAAMIQALKSRLENPATIFID
jgi:2-oxoisovalerate dehydrogenase E2 component (dihydrolipoyl transacylase)